MQQSPLKDKDLGVVINYETKFADVRQKATEEHIQRKAKHKKDKTTPVPEATPGKIVVASSDKFKSNKQYYLYEVVDFRLIWGKSFEYFGILLKTTCKEDLDRIGRIGSFGGAGLHWAFNSKITKLTEDKIKWLEETESENRRTN